MSPKPAVDDEKKSTKDTILDYLQNNRGREIKVSEIHEKKGFGLSRISNAIKELELLDLIKIERRKLKKGRYTVISLKGDIITKKATHERDLNPITVDTEEEKDYDLENFSIPDAIEELKNTSYTQSAFREYIEPYYDSYLTLVTEIIQPMLYEIGSMWEREDITVAEEHLMSARLEKLIIDLIKKETRRNDKLIILTPVENEQHTLVLLTLELLLIERGYNIINLSRSISILSIIEFIKKLKKKPDWVFFSITMESYLNNLKQDIRQIKDNFRSDEFKIAVGGQGVKNLDVKNNLEADSIVKNVKDLEILFSVL